MNELLSVIDEPCLATITVVIIVMSFLIRRSFRHAENMARMYKENQ